MTQVQPIFDDSRLQAFVAASIQAQRTPLLEIHNGGRIFRLNEPLYVQRYAENGYIYLESRQLSIIAYGRSEQEAASSFYEDFSMMWNSVAECDDESLTREAAKVKAEFRRVVNAVVQE